MQLTIWKLLLLLNLTSCVCSSSPALVFRLKAAFRLFVERKVTGGILIRQSLRHRKRSLAIRNWFGIGIASAGSAFAMRNRTPRIKQSHNLPTARMSSCSLRRTWMISMREPVCRQKRWCKFMDTFLSRNARAVIFLSQVGAVHLNRPALVSFKQWMGDWGPVTDAKQR